MKRVLILVILSMANFALAWDNITEMDIDI